MWKNINFGNCLSYLSSRAASEAYLDSHAASQSIIGSHAAAEGTIHPSARPGITISRMCGAGGRTVASKLADYLQPHTPAGHNWTIFDKNLIEKVLEDHHLSKCLARLSAGRPKIPSG